MSMFKKVATIVSMVAVVSFSFFVSYSAGVSRGRGQGYSEGIQVNQAEAIAQSNAFQEELGKENEKLIQDYNGLIIEYNILQQTTANLIGVPTSRRLLSHVQVTI